MKKRSLQGIGYAGCSMLLLGGMAQAQTSPDAGPPAASRLEALQKELAVQARQLEEMRRALAEQQATIRELRNTVNSDTLSHKRGGQGAGVTGGNMATNAAAAGAAASATQINNTAQQGVQAQQAPVAAPPDAPPQAQAAQPGESAAGVE